MKRFEIAAYADLLPTEQRDRFARFAQLSCTVRVRDFVRYQMQMRHRGFEPAAAPHDWGRGA